MEGLGGWLRRKGGRVGRRGKMTTCIMQSVDGTGGDGHMHACRSSIPACLEVWVVYTSRMVTVACSSTSSRNTQLQSLTYEGRTDDQQPPYLHRHLRLRLRRSILASTGP